MMVWTLAVTMAVTTYMAIWWFAKPARIVLELTAVAMLIGLAGYAWQGAPDLVGAPRASTSHI